MTLNLRTFIEGRQWLRQILRWQHLGLCILILFTLGLHFSAITHPNAFLLDESYYVPDAKSIMAKEGTMLPEQPPLGKLFIVEGIRLFGDNPLGWRFFSVIFGTTCIVLLYFICRRLKMSNEATMLATALFGLENLSFVQASVAMLDVYSLTFMLVALLLYLRSSFFLSGVFVGLSALAKLPGALVLAVFFLYWLFTGRKQWQQLVIPVLTATLSFLVLMPLLDYAITMQITNPIQRIGYMLSFASTLTFASSSLTLASRPWDWLMNRGAVFYDYDPQYIAIASFTISAFIIPAALYMLFKGTRDDRAALLGFLWFAVTYLPWIAVSLVISRLTYIYYLYPVIGAICIGLGIGLSEILNLWRRNRQSKNAAVGAILVLTYLALHLAILTCLSPLAPPLVEWFPM